MAHISRSGLALALAVGALAALIWLARAPLHRLPLERDEGAYAVIARDWLAGAIPYRDRFDHKPPLVYAAYMPAVALGGAPGGDAVLALRRWATAWLLLTAAAAGWLGGQLWASRPAALASAGLTGLWASSMALQGPTFNSEAVMLLPACLALGCAIRAMRRRQSGWWLAAGALLALAALGKPVGILLAPALLLGGLLDQRGLRRGLLNGLEIISGVALVAVPLIGYFAHHGALEAARAALLDYNLRYAAASGSQADLAGLLPIWRPLAPLALAALAGAALAGRTTRSRVHLVAAAWSLGLAAGAVASLRAYPHYYLAAVPALAIWAAGIGLAAAGPARALPRLSAAAGLIGLAALPALTLAPYYRLSPDEQISKLYPVDGANYFSLSDNAAAWVNRHTPPGSALWVWAAEPQIYYLSGRAVPTRFPYDYPLAILPGARDEVVRALDAAPPETIITYADVRPERFGGVRQASGYILRARLGGFDIWTLP